MLNVENQKSTYSTIVSDGALALSRQIQKACFMHPAHPGTITMDRFTFVPRAQQAQDAGFVSQLSIDSGEGTARYQRFLLSSLFLRQQKMLWLMPWSKPVIG